MKHIVGAKFQASTSRSAGIVRGLGISSISPNPLPRKPLSNLFQDSQVYTLQNIAVLRDTKDLVYTFLAADKKTAVSFTFSDSVVADNALDPYSV